MNDAAWRTVSLQDLLHLLRGQITPRKCRLIACAGMRQTDWAMRGASGAAILLAERFADGQASAHELASARYGGRYQSGHAAWAVCWPPGEDPVQMLLRALEWVKGFTIRSPHHSESLKIDRRHADLVREVLANPFQPHPIDPAWRAWNDGTVGKLAQAIHDDRAFDQMPILGDALEESGCADVALLDHCRSQRPHVLGCWLLDAILGRA